LDGRDVRKRRLVSKIESDGGGCDHYRPRAPRFLPESGGDSDGFWSILERSAEHTSTLHSCPTRGSSDLSFLKLNPMVAVVTTIDREHLDFYQNLAEIQTAFGQFLKDRQSTRLHSTLALPEALPISRF